MGKVTSFEELRVWQHSRELAKEIYLFTKREAFSKDFELRNQINKSGGSMMDNIAEGFERGGNKEFSQFLSIAKGSCGEIRSQLYGASDRLHISETEFEGANQKSLIISKQLATLMAYLKSSDLKGVKYANEP
jgi:four helix bundle protein